MNFIQKIIDKLYIHVGDSNAAILKDWETAKGVRDSDGQTKVLMFPHHGFRVRVNRDSFSWCSSHDFYLQIRDWDLESNDDHDWICLGTLPASKENFEEILCESREILDKEHEKLMSWGLSCSKKNLDYFVTFDKTEYHFIKDDHNNFGHYIIFAEICTSNNRLRSKGGYLASYPFPNRILNEMLNPFAFDKHINDIKEILTDKFREDLKEFSE